MLERLKNHRDPKYRARHRSLHYYVWDLGVANEKLEVEETFVFLAIIKGDVDQLFLNLLEMWCSLMLQTLTRNALRSYLPVGTLAPYAGGHLNVALPLHQSIQGDPVQDELCNDLYSRDPSVQAYYASLRQNFFDLKNSPNPFLRELYEQKVRVSQLSRAETIRQSTANKSLQGRNVTVRCDEWRQSFSMSHWIFEISRKAVHLNHGALLFVRFDLCS